MEKHAGDGKLEIEMEIGTKTHVPITGTMFSLQTHQ